eukprot:2657123-Rhodomonas_salina.6
MPSGGGFPRRPLPGTLLRRLEEEVPDLDNFRVDSSLLTVSPTPAHSQHPLRLVQIGIECASVSGDLSLPLHTPRRSCPPDSSGELDCMAVERLCEAGSVTTNSTLTSLRAPSQSNTVSFQGVDTYGFPLRCPEGSINCVRLGNGTDTYGADGLLAPHTRGSRAEVRSRASCSCSSELRAPFHAAATFVRSELVA